MDFFTILKVLKNIFKTVVSVLICSILLITTARADESLDKFINTAIQFCNDIRSHQRIDLPVPDEFHKYFEDTLKKVESNPRIEKKSIELLRQDAHQLIVQKKLDLYNWNVLLFRVVQLFQRAVLNRELWPNKDNFPEFNPNVNQAEILRLLDENYQKGQDVHHYRFLIKERMTPVLSSGFCPVATPPPGLISLKALNWAYGNRTYPMGVATGPEMFDEMISLPDYLFEHDILPHAIAAHETDLKETHLPLLFKHEGFQWKVLSPRATIPLSLQQFLIQRETGFLKRAEKLSEEEKQQFHLIQFLFRHELFKTSFDIKAICAKKGIDDLDPRRFYLVSELNGALPVELQGNTEAVQRFLYDPVIEEKHGRKVYKKFGPFGDQDEVGPVKKAKINFYLESAKNLYCKVWKQYYSEIEITHATKKIEELIEHSKKRIDMSSPNTCK